MNCCKLSVSSIRSSNQSHHISINSFFSLKKNIYDFNEQFLTWSFFFFLMKVVSFHVLHEKHKYLYIFIFLAYICVYIFIYIWISSWCSSKLICFTFINSNLQKFQQKCLLLCKYFCEKAYFFMCILFNSILFNLFNKLK